MLGVVLVVLAVFVKLVVLFRVELVEEELVEEFNEELLELPEDPLEEFLGLFEDPVLEPEESRLVSSGFSAEASKKIIFLFSSVEQMTSLLWTLHLNGRRFSFTEKTWPSSSWPS